MGNTLWVTEVESRGLWELWETAFVAVFQGAVDAFSASTAPGASTAGFPNGGARARETTAQAAPGATIDSRPDPYHPPGERPRHHR